MAIYKLEDRVYFDGAIAVDAIDISQAMEDSLPDDTVENAQDESVDYDNIEEYINDDTESSNYDYNDLEAVIASFEEIDLSGIDSELFNGTAETPKVLLVSSELSDSTTADDSTIIIEYSSEMTVESVLDQINAEIAALDSSDLNDVSIELATVDGNIDITDQAYDDDGSLDADELSQIISLNSDNLGSEQETRLLLISSAVTDADILADTANDNTIVITYDQDISLDDMAQQIKDTLGDAKVDSIGLVTHSNGVNEFSLTDSEIVNSESVGTDSEQTAFWSELKSSLNENGRIDLFACNVAQGEDGQSLIDSLENLTSINFAASDDLTGNESSGGDWILETDDIDLTSAYFNTDSVVEYDRLLQEYEWTIELHFTYNDNYGYTYDWFNNSIDVLINGEIIYDDVTLAAGLGISTYSFYTEIGDNITVNFNNTGRNASYCFYNIYDHSGNLRYTSGAGSIPTSNYELTTSNIVLTGDTATTYLNTPIAIDVTSNDINCSGGEILINSVSEVINGSAVVLNNKIIYTPNDSWLGTESLTYTVNESGVSHECTVTITVEEATGIIEDLSDYDCNEQASAAIIDSDITLDSNGSTYNDSGYITFSIIGSTSTDNLVLSSESDPNSAGAISISDGIVYLGNGTYKDRIGTVDSVENGLNGQSLKINFSAPLGENSNFEDGTYDGWTVYEENYGDYFNGDEITYIYNNSYDNATGTAEIHVADEDGATYSITIETDEVGSGNYSLRLLSTGTITFTNLGNGLTDYGSLHGPYVISSSFDVAANDTISVDWAALEGDDSYEVFGSLVGDGPDNIFGTEDDTRILLFSQRGDSQTWTTSSVSVTEADTYRFEFVSGTYDQTGGFAVGASLYIDNARLVPSVQITDDVVTAIARLVTFENTSDTPTEGARTLSVVAVDGDGTASAATSTITITSLNDAPQIDVNKGIIVEIGETTSISNLVLSEGDPDDSGTDVIYTLTSETNQGTLWIDINGDAILDSGEELITGSSFTQQDIDDGLINYTHTESSAENDSFDFILSDGGENGSIPANGTFYVLVNDPVINDELQLIVNSSESSVNEGEAVTIDETMLYSLDPDDNSANINYIINSLVSNGTLTLNGTVLDVGNTFTQADIDNGLLVYTHNGTETTSDSFDFIAIDGGEDNTTGTDATFNISIIPVNDLPTASESRVGSATNTVYVFNSNDFNFTDPDSGDELSYIKITSTETAGTLQYSVDGTVWNDVILNQEISKEDIDSGKLRFLPEEDEAGINYSRFAFKVSDGEEYSSSEYDFFIDIATNNVPTGNVVITGDIEEGGTVTADTSGISDADGLGDFTYQWYLNGEPIEGATGETYDIPDGQRVVGGTLSVAVSYTDGGGTTEELSAQASESIANVNDEPVGSVIITGDIEEGGTVTADTSGISDADGLGDFTYQWYLNGEPIEGATGETYDIPDGQRVVGGTLSVAVSYTDGGGTTEELSAQASESIANVNDEPVGSVIITGDIEEGGTVTADTSGISDADGLGDFTYQWYLNGEPIEGATGETYDIPDGQSVVGGTLSVAVSYTDGGGTTEELSAQASESIANVNDEPVGSVIITGDIEEGGTVTADTSGISDADGLGDFTYQWYLNGEPIEGATGETYDIPDGQSVVGGTLSVAVSYTDGGGTTEELSAQASESIANVNDEPVGSVIITGDIEEGGTVTADTSGISDADGLGDFTYQWYLNGEPIEGATGETYDIPDGQRVVGGTLSVAVSYTDGGGTTEELSAQASESIANVNDEPVGSVIITGDIEEGGTVTADTSGISDADGLGDFTYQWYLNGEPIEGATGETYDIPDGQSVVGGTLSVAVSYTDGGGTTEELSAQASESIANVNDEPVGSVIITGDIEEGGTVTADTSGISDADGLGDFTYQWYLNGEPIEGATGETYDIPDGQSVVGGTLSVAVSYTDGGGTTEELSAQASESIANVNDEPVGSVIITGDIEEGGTVTADTSGISDADGLGDFTYQWYLNGEPIEGATGETYDIPDGQRVVGGTLSVAVSYTDGGGTTEELSAQASESIANVNDAAVIAGTSTGEVEEDVTQSVSGTLTIDDTDGTAEEAFVANTETGTYGTFAVDAAGSWSYVLNNNSAVVQALTSLQSPEETFSITTVDGTAATVTITVNGQNEQTMNDSTPDTVIVSHSSQPGETGGQNNTTDTIETIITARTNITGSGGNRNSGGISSGAVGNGNSDNGEYGASINGAGNGEYGIQVSRGSGADGEYGVGASSTFDSSSLSGNSYDSTSGTEEEVTFNNEFDNVFSEYLDSNVKLTSNQIITEIFVKHSLFKSDLDRALDDFLIES